MIWPIAVSMHNWPNSQFIFFKTITVIRINFYFVERCHDFFQFDRFFPSLASASCQYKVVSLVLFLPPAARRCWLIFLTETSSAGLIKTLLLYFFVPPYEMNLQYTIFFQSATNFILPYLLLDADFIKFSVRKLRKNSKPIIMISFSIYSFPPLRF